MGYDLANIKKIEDKYHSVCIYPLNSCSDKDLFCMLRQMLELAYIDNHKNVLLRTDSSDFEKFICEIHSILSDLFSEDNLFYIESRNGAYRTLGYMCLGHIAKKIATALLNKWIGRNENQHHQQEQDFIVEISKVIANLDDGRIDSLISPPRFSASPRRMNPKQIYKKKMTNESKCVKLK